MQESADTRIHYCFCQMSSDTQVQGRQTVTALPGDGVGPELFASIKEVFTASRVPVDFEEMILSEMEPEKSASLESVIESCQKNTVCLKGIISSPVNFQYGLLQTLNMKFRRGLDLFANVVSVKSLPGCQARHRDLDFVIIREMTEGEYSALEHESVPGVIECLKIVTREKSTRIARFAFDYAIRHGRKKVTAVHKANIMKLADGLFLECCTDVAALYPTIEFESMIVDNTCMQLVSNPHQFDVMVMGNLYGNIIDNLAAGLVGGAGVVPGENYGSEVAVFEPGARHAYAEQIGKDTANPTAMLLSACNLLSHLHLHEHADRISKAVKKTIADGTASVTCVNTITKVIQLNLASQSPQ
ncbi:hypothetical protein NP493_1041g01080 [Ridgeia piscesae]|uniref:Isocitrate dehydrogenase [NAD] subunit, mitochondrial n=1 Tax=Ridgeia piscesae TaxID=27915 RepID=A0AAD9NK67_RIDPI|nr:hypothetical protein NP493_1041g01080 [Ridgeia piscesae]